MKTTIIFTLLLCILSGCDKKPTDCPRCNMEPEPSWCTAAFQKYYYNKKTGTCEAFVWGGCGDYPFDTKEECEAQCYRSCGTPVPKN